MDDQVGRTTLDKACCAIANQAGISLVDSASRKLKTRIDAGLSEKCLVCYMGLVGATLFYSIPEEDRDIREELKNLDPDARVMYDIVTKLRGSPQGIVKPWNNWGIEDTGFFHQNGVVEKEGVLFTTKESVKDSGTDSLWTYSENDSPGWGIRVSMTLMMSMAGTHAPIVFCVGGLNERELVGTDFLVMDVPKHSTAKLYTSSS